MLLLEAGAIIGDGDRKSWDARRPMIWNNFSIFRTNCGILTSCIRAASRTCHGFSRVCCHVAWSNMVRAARFLADFSQRWQGIRKAKRTRALLCTFMLWGNGQGEFFRVKISLTSRFEWIISARAVCCKRKLLRLLSKKTLHSGIELISESLRHKPKKKKLWRSKTLLYPSISNKLLAVLWKSCWSLTYIKFRVE